MKLINHSLKRGEINSGEVGEGLVMVVVLCSMRVGFSHGAHLQRTHVSNITSSCSRKSL